MAFILLESFIQEGRRGTKRPISVSLLAGHDEYLKLAIHDVN
jgi:hypothetical protein